MFELAGKDKHGLLAQVLQLLVAAGCEVLSAAVSCDLCFLRLQHALLCSVHACILRRRICLQPLLTATVQVVSFYKALGLVVQQ